MRHRTRLILAGASCPLAAWPLVQVLMVAGFGITGVADLFSWWGIGLAWVSLLAALFHLVLTGAVPEAKKRLWAALLFALHLFAIPAYWFFYIWRPAVRSGKVTEAT